MSQPVDIAISQASAGVTGGDEIVAAPGASSRIEVLGYKMVADAAGTVQLKAGTNEVWTVAVDATGGTYTLTYGGQTTSNIAFDASAATVQAALEALSNVEVGDVSVSLSGTTYTITTAALLGGQNLTAPTADSTLLTGGTHTATVATPTQGTSASMTGAVPVAAKQDVTAGYAGQVVWRLPANTSLRLVTATSKMFGHLQYRIVGA